MGRIFGATVAVLLLCVGCSTSQDEKELASIYDSDRKNSVASLVSHLSNADLKWSVAYELEPILNDKITEDLLSRPADEINPYLLRALKEEDKFAVAHVLLTKKNLARYPLDLKYWNKLRVRPENLESPYNPSQITDLVKYWEIVMEMKEEATLDY